MTEIVLFYVWQSDLLKMINKNFIWKSLVETKRILEERNILIELDHNSQNCAGSFSINPVLRDKIDKSHILVADLTATQFPSHDPTKRSPNSNVLIEFISFRTKAEKDFPLSISPAIGVVNTGYGQVPTHLPSDIRDYNCLSYDLKEEEANLEERRKFEETKLVEQLIENIELIVKEISKQKNFKSQNLKPEKPDFLKPNVTVCRYLADKFDSNPVREIKWQAEPYMYLGLIPEQKISLSDEELEEICNQALFHSIKSIFPLGGTRNNLINQPSKFGGRILGHEKLVKENTYKFLSLLQLNNDGVLWGIDAYSVNVVNNDKISKPIILADFEQKYAHALLAYLFFFKKFLKIKGKITLVAGMRGIEGRSISLKAPPGSYLPQNLTPPIDEQEIIAETYSIEDLSNFEFPTFQDQRTNSMKFGQNIQEIIDLHNKFLIPFFERVFKATLIPRPNTNDYFLFSDDIKKASWMH